MLITSVSTGGHQSEERLTEHVSLNFAIVNVEYVRQDSQGRAGATIPMDWNVAKKIQA